KGNLNLYRIIVEDILRSMLAKGGCALLLLPSSILSEKASSLIRKEILENYNLKSVSVFSEKSKIVSASQELALLEIYNQKSTKTIKFNKDFDDTHSTFDLSQYDLLKLSSDYKIYQLNKIEYQIIEKLSTFPKIKELPFIKNRRGELDVTLHKKLITKDKGLKLIRGKNIKNNKELFDYVSPDFLKYTSKIDDINSERIACQQVSNRNQKNRLKFIHVENDAILANSVNYIALDFNLFSSSAPSQFNLDYLLKLLNSNFYSYYFSLISVNNHINNFELDELPVPLDKNFIVTLNKLSDEEEINNYVNDYFSIDIDYNIEPLNNDIQSNYIDDLKELNINLDKGSATQFLFNPNLLNL